MSVTEECVLAVADLVGRSGGREFEIGWLYDEKEDPLEYAIKGSCWWAKAQYRGARLTIDDQPTPAHACDGLAHQLLDGGTCTHCEKTTTTAQTPLGTFVHARRPADTDACVWHRDGPKWKRGSDAE